LNKVVDKGYMPMIKPRKISAGGFGSKIRDRMFPRRDNYYEDTSKSIGLCIENFVKI
jgi:hypothetical protein